MKLVLVILLFLGVSDYSTKLDTSHLNCTQESDRAKRGVVFFLTLDQKSFAQERVRLGLENIPPEQVKHVANEENCKNLEELSKSSSDWEIDLSNRDKFYYRTDDFYFILYLRKGIGTGYTPLIIFDKEFNLLDKMNI